MLHPRESVKNSLLVINARGELEDGRSFAVHLTSLPPRRHLRVTIGD